MTFWLSQFHIQLQRHSYMDVSHGGNDEITETCRMAFWLSQFHIQLQEHSSMYHAHESNDKITETCRMTFWLSQFHIQLPEHSSMYLALEGNDEITETSRMAFSLSQFPIQLPERHRSLYGPCSWWQRGNNINMQDDVLAFTIPYLTIGTPLALWTMLMVATMK